MRRRKADEKGVSGDVKEGGGRFRRRATSSTIESIFMFVFLRGLFILEGGQDNYLFLFELRGRLQNELESRVGGREESGFVFDGRTVSSVEMEGDECFADGYAEFPVEHTGGLVGFEHKVIGVIGGLGERQIRSLGHSPNARVLLEGI